MKSISQKVKIRACNCPVDIVLSQDKVGFMLEKNENGKWFVTTEVKGRFYLQENLEGGEIRDLGCVDNLPEAIQKIAWAR